jgi:hypothetical protein
MYKNVLLTDKEIALVKRVIGDHLHEKISPEAKNLTIILNRLRDIKPTKKYNQSINYGNKPTNQIEIKKNENQ